MTRTEWAKEIILLLGDRESLGLEDEQDYQDTVQAVERSLRDYEKAQQGDEKND